MQTNNISAMILAGGKGRRMNNQDKGLVSYQGKPMIEHVLDKLPTSLSDIYISANRNIQIYQKYPVTVIPDGPENLYQGPLAGIYSVLQHIQTPLLLVLPCDSPRISPTLPQQLWQILQEKKANIVCAHDGQRLQPLFSLLHVSLLKSLENYLQSGQQQVLTWMENQHPALFDGSSDSEQFININTLQQLSSASYSL